MWAGRVAALWLCVAGIARAQSNDDPLARPLSLRLTDATIEHALRTIASAAAVRLSFSSDILPATARVTVQHDRTTVGTALREVLRGTNLGSVVVGTGHVVILRAPLVATPADTASPGIDTPRLSPQMMDRVVVMGTPVAGAPERELATAVTVVTARRVEREHARDMRSLFRSTIPGVIAWDLGASGPIPHVGAVRGSSSFSANYLKTYLDGVELASPYLLFAIDPAVVEQLEVIQGPQGSAMYGADAISGVAHVTTNKGAFGAGWRPRVDASVSAGVAESRYAASAPIVQHHSLAARGGGAVTSYAVTGAMSRNGGFVDGGHAASYTAVGGARGLIGPLLLESTVRTSRFDFNAPVSPTLARTLGTRAVPVIARAAQGQTINQHTVGATATYQPFEIWRHSLVAGFDRNYGALAPQRNPASVADKLLGASEEDARRASLRYSSSLRLEPSAAIASTITVGLEHSRLERERSGPASVIGTSPMPQATRGAALYVDTVTNTGWFGQAKVDIASSLYLTAGIRGERNSSFGERHGTAWSPMAGAAYVMTGESLTLKWRAAFGRGIRPPPPSARRVLTTLQFRQIANPDLAPERQSGIEGGIDLLASDRLSLSLTAFDQTADGLIQHVIPSPRISPKIIQQQNVGQISNRGTEAQATMKFGRLDLDAAAATVASKVRALSAAYSGDLRVGDRLPEVPSLSSAGALSLTIRGVRTTGGATFLGSWTGYDWVSYYSALAQGAEPPASMRAYWVTYPSTVRPYVMVSGARGALLTWFVRVDNLTNEQRDTRDNLEVTAGRTITAGMSISSSGARPD